MPSLWFGAAADRPAQRHCPVPDRPESWLSRPPELRPRHRPLHLPDLQRARPERCVHGCMHGRTVPPGRTSATFCFRSHAGCRRLPAARLLPPLPAASRRIAWARCPQLCLACSSAGRVGKAQLSSSTSPVRPRQRGQKPNIYLTVTFEESPRGRWSCGYTDLTSLSRVSADLPLQKSAVSTRSAS